jgi:hypothetical protein
MAYIPNTDEPQPGSNTITPGAVGTQLAPSGGVGSAPAGGSLSSPQAPGGQFATLQSYLTANQGQAAPLANKITSGIGQQYNTLQGQNASTLSGVQGQVAQGSTPLDQTLLAQEAANPVSFASNPGNVQSFQKQLNDQYTGPQSAESTPAFTAQQNAINKAISTGQNQTGTEAGREQLLQQTEERPTTGVTALNSAILTQSPDYLSQVQNAYQPFSNLLTGLSSGASDINKQIAQNQAQAQQASKTANQQISGQTSALNTNVNTELQNLQNQYNQYNTGAATLANQLQSGQLPAGYGVDPGLQAFIAQNLTPWINQYTPGYTPTYNFANATPQFPTAAAPTINQAATPQDFAMLQALGTLAGAPVASPLSGLDPTLAGTYTTPTLPTINNKALAGDIQAGFAANPAIVNAPAYEQYGSLLSALAKYQGNVNDPFYHFGQVNNPINGQPNWQQIYGYPVAPTIA